MDYTQVIAVAAVAIANLGTVIAFFLSLDKKIEENRLTLDKKIEENRINLDKKLEENRKETHSILQAIQQEMKDFHIKLATQDLEFKMRLTAIEEEKSKKQF